MDDCDQCRQIEARPTADWQSVLFGGEVTRNPIGMKYTAWECPICGQEWTCVERHSGALSWTKR